MIKKFLKRLKAKWVYWRFHQDHNWYRRMKEENEKWGFYE